MSQSPLRSPMPSDAASGAADTSRLDRLLADAAKLSNYGDVGGAARLYHQVLAIDPDHPEAIRRLGILFCWLRQYDRAEEFIARALARTPDDDDYRLAVAHAHYMTGVVSLSRGDVERGRALYRRALAYAPGYDDARIAMCNLLKIVDVPAELADMGCDLAPAELGQHVLIACMPKSGSSFLYMALSRLTGWVGLMLSYAYLQNEQEIYLPHLLTRAHVNTVTQQHCRATDANVHILQAFGMRPIVLLRNLFDIVISLVDFYDNGAIANTFFVGRWENLDRERRCDLIIDHIMPWYLGFYASWVDVARSGRLDCHFLTYGEMVADKPGTLAALAARYGVERSLDECAAVVQMVEGDRRGTRHNKGITGRGKTQLTTAQKDRLRRLADYYGDIDFSVVGL